MIKKITVLLPTYNDAAFLKYSIKSILNQTYKEFELLIVDDGSTDNTEEIISLFNDPRINYKKKPHTGLADSLNFGLLNASHEWIARMDADDFSHPQRVERQINFSRKYPNYNLIGSWYAIFKKNKISYIIKATSDDKNIKKSLSLHSPFCHAGVIYDKNIIMKYGYKNQVFEDYELWLRALKEMNFYVLPEILYYVRFRDDSLSREDIENKYNLQYRTQQPYYENSIRDYFGIEKRSDELKIRGWREYFYGTKLQAFNLWGKLGLTILLNPKILFGLITLLLPRKYFTRLKEQRVRYRLAYYTKYFSKLNRDNRKTFKDILIK